MEFDPANVLLGAVVILLVTILIGGVFAVVFATWGRRTRAGEDWLIRDLDELHSRLEVMAPEIARLDAQIRHLESVQAEVRHLLEENERLQQERNELLDVFARIADCWGGSLARGLKVSDAAEPVNRNETGGSRD